MGPEGYHYLDGRFGIPLIGFSIFLQADILALQDACDICMGESYISLPDVHFRKTETSIMPLNGINAKIIALLQKDARLPYRDVAQKLGMNESTVRKRILALREKQVIKFSVDVDHFKLGYNARSFIGLDVEPSKILEVGRKLSRIPEVKSVSTTLGEHAFLVEVWAEDSDSLSEIIDKRLAPIEGVTKISPSILVEKLK